MSDILHSGTRSLNAPMLFSALDPDLQGKLRTSARYRDFEEGQIIQLRGDEADGFWLIESGSVSVGQYLPEGDFRGIALLGPGDSWGELALFGDRPRVVDAVARSKCRVGLIPADALESALFADPISMRRMIEALSTQLQETLELLAGLRRGSAAPRVAGLLSTLAAGGDGGGVREISVTQQELGELLGLTRATVNAVLRDLEQTGVIERSYGRIVVRDREALALAGFA